MTNAADPGGSQNAPSDILDKANERIRDAAKWLIASSAAVAAALIAGSQLSSIGKLAVAWPTSVEAARLWVAVAGAVGGLVAIVYILWTAVQLLPEEHVTVRELSGEWNNPSTRLRPAVDFLKRQPKYLQGFGSPMELESHRQDAVHQLDTLTDPAAVAEMNSYITDLDQRIVTLEARATRYWKARSTRHFASSCGPPRERRSASSPSPGPRTPRRRRHRQRNSSVRNCTERSCVTLISRTPSSTTPTSVTPI